MSFKVGDIVRMIDTYWHGELNEPRDDIGKLFIIDHLGSPGSYSIIRIDGGSSSSWWHDDQLEFVEHGGEKALNEVKQKMEELERRNHNLEWISQNYPNIPATSWLELFYEIGYDSSFNRNGEYFVLGEDIRAISPIFSAIFDGKEKEECISVVEKVFKPNYVDKYKSSVGEFYDKIHKINASADL